MSQGFWRALSVSLPTEPSLKRWRSAYAREEFAPPPAIAVALNEFLPRWFQLFVGVAEVAAAAGLTLPRLTNVKPWLVSWAAGGLMIVTGSATVLHLARNEFGPAATTILLFALSAVVAYGRRGRAVAIVSFDSNPAHA